MNLFKYHKHELIALLMFSAGALLSMLGLIQKVPLILGILGVMILSAGLFIYCLRYASELSYKQYYKETYEVEHACIEEEIRKSMLFNRYQQAIINRYESACRDLGLSDEQKDWLLELLLAEKAKVDEQIKQEGGGQI